MNNLPPIEEIIEKSGGFFCTRNKIHIHSTKQFTVIDTPGIKTCIDSIKYDNNEALKLTNKSNNMFVVTDGTGFLNYSKNSWNSEFGLIFTEAKSYYYKTCFNIDSYPLALHHIKCESYKDLHTLLFNMSTTYIAVELYKISRSKLEPLIEMLAKSPVDIVIGTDDTRAYINEKIKNLNCYEFSENCILGIFFRACMDYYAWGVMSPDMINHCLEEMAKTYTVQEPSKHREIQMYLYEKAVKYIKDNDQHYGNKPLHDSRLNTKTNVFTEHEQTQMFKPSLEKHNHFKHGEASHTLHQKMKGLLETGTKFRLFDNRWIDQLLSDENIQRLFLLVKEDPEYVEKITCKKNYCAVATNGSSVLDKSFIGGHATLPLIESKCMYMKEFAKIDCMPICFKDFCKFEQSKILEMMSPTFGAICLEYVKAPDCFFIENYLKENAHCPVYHAGQHSAAIVVLAAQINALKLAKKLPEDLKVVINGAGAAGLSIAELLLCYGTENIIITDTRGALYKQRTINMNDQKCEMAHMTNQKDERGKLENVIKDADVFIGVSVENVFKADLITQMADRPIIFALAQPSPEVNIEEAKNHAYIVASGMIEQANAVNTLLATPGMMRALMNTRASDITLEMKTEAAYAIANSVKPDYLDVNCILPNFLDYEVHQKVSLAVAKMATEQGIITKQAQLAQNTLAVYMASISMPTVE